MQYFVFLFRDVAFEYKIRIREIAIAHVEPLVVGIRSLAAGGVICNVVYESYTIEKTTFCRSISASITVQKGSPWMK